MTLGDILFHYPDKDLFFRRRFIGPLGVDNLPNYPDNEVPLSCFAGDDQHTYLGAFHFTVRYKAAEGLPVSSHQQPCVVAAAFSRDL